MTSALAQDVTYRLGPEKLLALAATYVWWKAPDEALKYPLRILRLVMNMGRYEDICYIIETLGDDVLRELVRQSEAGEFNARSWHYWHIRLELSDVDKIPPMPVRRFG